MSKSPQQSLIEQIEAKGSIDNRFNDPKCINYVGENDRTGVLSLVFQAFDDIEQKHVALKFMDPSRLGDSYRLDAFNREPILLERVKDKKRCLQLITGPSPYGWEIENPKTTLTVKFFATEWLEEEVEDTFENQQLILASQKLKLFRKIILAVEAIHSANISHRDIKPDNMRVRVENGDDVVVLIDFGTAAHSETPNLQSEYQKSVGAPAYASPEAHAGLAGERTTGYLTDIYALGCLLFELFNKELFIKAVVDNTPFERAITIMRVELSGVATNDLKKVTWKEKAAGLNNAVQPPSILYNGHSVPSCIKTLLESVHSKMTQFDFYQRSSDLNVIRKKIDSAIRTLENELLQAKKLRDKRLWREKRIQKLQRREAKLQAYLSKKLEVNNV